MGYSLDVICDDLFFVYNSKFDFPIITVYKSPLDYPEKYVARIFDLDVPTCYIMVKESFDDICNSIDSDMVMVGTSDNDDKKIVCSFL